MGNYKEGYLNLTLKEDTPMDIILLIADLASYDDDHNSNSYQRENRIKKLKNKNNNELFKSQYLSWLILDIFENITFETKDVDGKYGWHYFAGYKTNILLEESNSKKNIENFTKIYHKILDEDICYEDAIQYIIKRKFKRINFYIRYNSKYYDNEFEKILNFLKPYIEETEECLGEIYDEDGFLRKNYYLNESTFEKIIAKQKHMCKGCPNEPRDEVKCKNYKFCSIAYNNGKNNITQ